jgi:hypothetical protein
MRRAAATVLFALLAVPMLLPLYALRGGDSDSQLPACCRRGGTHHCGMTASEPQAPEHAFRQAPSKCCFYPTFKTVAPTTALYPPSAAAFYSATVQHPAIHAQVQANLVVAEARSHQKRGPPFLAV